MSNNLNFETMKLRAADLRQKLTENENFPLTDDDAKFLDDFRAIEWQEQQKQKQVDFLQRKIKESQKSIAIQLPNGTNTIANCVEHGWFAGVLVYTSCYNRKEVENINSSSTVKYWGARCPHGCFVLGGSKGGHCTVEELKQMEKPRVCTTITSPVRQ